MTVVALPLVVAFPGMHAMVISTATRSCYEHDERLG